MAQVTDEVLALALERGVSLPEAMFMLALQRGEVTGDISGEELGSLRGEQEAAESEGATGRAPLREPGQ